VRRGTEREKRDLFAERELDEGSVKQTLLPPPSFGFNGGVGARNENSVLFRVDQLTAAARVKTPAPTPAIASEIASASVSTRGGADDDGVIDLKALASAPPRKIGLPVAPLFSEPPAVSLDVNETVQGHAVKPASKMRLIGAIAAGAAVLLVAGLGISLAFKGEEPVQHAAAVVTEPVPLVVAPPPEATAAPAPVAAADDSKDTKDQTEQASSEKSERGKKGKKGKKGKAAKSGPITNKTPAPAAKPAPKPADPCGCKGDFNCILACTAKRGK
jgi:hypothetical protein